MSLHAQKLTSSERLHRFLFTEIDNAGLVFFRIIFGILVIWHCVEAILTGWVRRNLILPKFTFSHIGMDWLQPLPGNGMYYYFILMALSGIGIALGFFYRFSIFVFTLLWSGVYFMQKTTYNNHYYLLILIGIILFFLPANADKSIDVKRNPNLKNTKMPAWCSQVMILQIAIVYFFATIAKFYPGWLDGTFTRNMLIKNDTFGFSELYSKPWFYISLAYAGIVYDLLIVPLLLWKRTRIIAFIASLIFHFFNKAHLGIGIFPFLALSFTIFFFPPEQIRKLFFRETSTIIQKTLSNHGKKVILYFFIPYFLLQIALPLRHWFIKGDVLWTEEGHRLSWRMMLRDRSGYTKFIILDKKTRRKYNYDLSKILTKKQIRGMRTKPDMIWQTAQKIKEIYSRKGKDIAIFIDSKAAINKAELRPLIDPAIDFTTVKWNYFSHNEWILLYE